MKQTFKKSVVFVLILLALTISAVGVTPAYAAGGGSNSLYENLFAKVSHRQREECSK